MALVVEDGTGLEDAEAFISVADADTYWAARGNAAWAILTESLKEQYLRLAADYMETRWRSRWKGHRLTAEQALAWPREGVLDEDGYEVADDKVPARVARANAEYAERARTAPLQPDPTVDDVGVVTRKREKVGPIEEETEYRETGQTVRLIRPYPKADRTLGGLLLPLGGEVIRG